MKSIRERVTKGDVPIVNRQHPGEKDITGGEINQDNFSIIRPKTDLSRIDKIIYTEGVMPPLPTTEIEYHTNGKISKITHTVSDDMGMDIISNHNGPAVATFYEDERIKDIKFIIDGKELTYKEFIALKDSKVDTK